MARGIVVATSALESKGSERAEALEDVVLGVVDIVDGELGRRISVDRII